MILVTTALPIEAKPLVSRLGLTAIADEAYPVYKGEDYVLVVTGVGALKASAATGWAMARFPGIFAAINAGFCGAAPEVAGLHEWVYISSIRDKASGRLSIPDILQKHPFREAALLTVPTVVKDRIDWNGVVDMEGSGFFEAARKFVSPDQISLIKWVSDPLTGSIHLEETSRAYAEGLDPAVDFIRQWPRFLEGKMDKAPEELVGQVEQRLKLTSTQRHYVRKWASGYLARGGDPGEVYRLLPEAVPASKSQNTRIFESLKNVFKN
ncbi:hypothetical protein G0Q06_06995 [Puniceicoccales bacterium CK1056]|uniref:Nucleoside phosphorylase domain-containing protein n=1 Tax=Oceanipulchritudo coccoides TaxID=2706888 RepID=A0A6B2M1V5_9BACT|nr:hypothetical protein [Oceanipulchritudo coccoides]NDV62189.1 hypothetical protein [Oceanipulchritudo coccoides]